MTNGTLKLYNKLDNSLLVSLDILDIFNIEDNLNESPSNMKVKVITSNTYREEFEVNTVAYHNDTNSWWVIKSDESTYLTTGEYEHEIQLIEYLEFYSYRHLPNCAFAPDTYTLQEMLTRLFTISKQTNIKIIDPAPSFLDFGKTMPFLSFENFTVANALKTIGRSINAIPKMFIDTTLGFVPTLTFINRNGLDNAMLQTLNDIFPVAYEKNANSSDQFTTRSISNISNAKSSNLVIAPKQGGFKNISPESPQYNAETAVITLPSKIESIEFMRVFFEVELKLDDRIIFKGYYYDEKVFYDELRARLSSSPQRVKLFNNSFYSLDDSEFNVLNNILLSKFPNAIEQSLLNSTDIIDIGFESLTDRWLKNKMVFTDSFTFNQIDDVPIKERTCVYEKFTNTIKMSKTYRDGLPIGASIADPLSGVVNGYYLLGQIGKQTGGGFNRAYLQLALNSNSFFFPNKVYTPNALVQVGYYPIADIKVSYDNDNEAQDEKFFNQNGKVIDSLSVTKLITSHTNDSVEGTKIRNARYKSPEDNFNSILPLGQLVREGNEIYLVSQRSIDGQVKNGNEYYNVIYTLSRNRIARSENIVADSAVVSYKTPDDNLVKRSQLYKDYIELSLENGNKDPEPYINMSKILLLENNFAGTNFDFTVLADNSYRPVGASTNVSVRYIQNPTIFDLHKSKLLNVNWQSNNLIGYRVEDTPSKNPVQTPILYTNALGFARSFKLLFLDTVNLNNAIIHFAGQYPTEYQNDPFVPFSDLTKVNDLFFGQSVSGQGNFSIEIEENGYGKDAFEIPVFEYMIQGNDDYNPLGNVIIGNELFTTYSKTSIVYNYVVSTTRFTAENANRLFTASSPAPSSTVQKVIITRPNDTTINLKLYASAEAPPPAGLNTVALQGKHIGIFAVGSDSTRKFLFAINDYAITGTNSNNDINLYINNWKI
jgi:hypothetical protein